MPEIHSTQHGFAYSACWPFNKNKEKIQKFKEPGDSRYFNVYQYSISISDSIFIKTN